MVNQVDYILCSQRWRSSIQSAKTRLGADCGSDHEFLIAKFRLKLKKTGKTTSAGSQREESHPWQGHAEGSLTKRKDVIGFRDSPWKFLSIHPPRPESACFTVLCFPPTLLSLTGDCPTITFFWKKLELLDNKSPGHNRSVSIQKPLWWLFSLPAGLVQLLMWLFEASWLREAQEA